MTRIKIKYMIYTDNRLVAFGYIYIVYMDRERNKQKKSIGNSKNKT